MLRKCSNAVTKIFVVLLLSLGRYEDVIGANITSWTYLDEKSWPGRRCQEGGWRQSPIDVRTSDVTTDIDEVFIKHGRLSFRGYKGVLMTGVNNGLTIQFSTEGDKTMHPLLTGGPLGRFYRLEQLHFHWMSEHAVNGRKYPLEMHFVHVRADLTVPEALQARDGLAIIAIFANIQSWAMEKEDDPLSEILEVIPLLQQKGSRVSGAMFNLRAIMDQGKDAYVTYAGSLTSPECNEAVIWIIFEKPMFLSTRSFRRFTHSSNVRHNYRSLQPLRHHRLYKPRPLSIFSRPALVEAVGGFFDNVKRFFTNLSRFFKKEVLKEAKQAL